MKQLVVVLLAVCLFTADCEAGKKKDKKKKGEKNKKDVDINHRGVAKLRTGCEFTFTIDYPKNKSVTPNVTCEAKCKRINSQIFVEGTYIRTTEKLKNEYNSMIAVNYRQKTLISCKVLPYQPASVLNKNPPDMCPDDYNVTAVADGTDYVRFCPDGWIGDPVRARCYFMSTKKNKQNITTVLKKCQQMEAEIVTPVDVHENFFVRKMLKYSVWIGIWDKDHDGVFDYIAANETFNLNSTKFIKWVDGEPKNRAGSDCTVMDKKGEWATKDCNNKLNYVCVKPGNGTLLPDLEDLEGVTVPPGSINITSPWLYNGTFASALPQNQKRSDEKKKRRKM